MAHKYKLVPLIDFSCSFCHSSWLLHGDAPDNHVTCPHCGHADAVEPIDPLQDQQVMVKLTPIRAACGD